VRNTCRTITAGPTAIRRRRSGITTMRPASPVWTSGSGSRASRSGAIQPGISTNRRQGRFALSLAAKGFVELDGGQFNLTAALPSTITLDFFLPTAQPNPFWFGAVQMYADCPSKGVNNAFLSQVE